MNKALAKGFGIGILVIIISVLCMYLGLAFYYRDGFSYNTWINGVYCTGKTLDEVNEELQEESSYPGLTIIDSDGKSYMISAQEVSLLMDYLPGLKAFYEKQSPLLWIDNMLGEKNNHEILPVVSYQVETFEEKVAKLPFFTGIRPENRRVKLCKGP